jgi:hypothetical protein
MSRRLNGELAEVLRHPGLSEVEDSRKRLAGLK